MSVCLLTASAVAPQKNQHILHERGPCAEAGDGGAARLILPLDRRQTVRRHDMHMHMHMHNMCMHMHMYVHMCMWTVDADMDCSVTS